MLKCISRSGLWQYELLIFVRILPYLVNRYSTGSNVSPVFVCWEKFQNLTFWDLAYITFLLYVVWLSSEMEKRQDMYGNLFWHKCVKCPLFCCLYSLNLIFSSRYFFSLCFTLGYEISQQRLKYNRKLFQILVASNL